MQLSNIRKLEFEALAAATFIHVLAILLYGIIAIRPEVPIHSERMVKINLAGTDHAIAGLEAINSFNENKPVMPGTGNIENSTAPQGSGISAGGASEVGYLQILQNKVQNSSNIPPEAHEKNISGKPVLRIEFERSGKVKSYKLAQPTGNKILDDAALEVGKKLMKKPFPPAPDDFYPSKEILKFDFGIDYTRQNQ